MQTHLLNTGKLQMLVCQSISKEWAYQLRHPSQRHVTWRCYNQNKLGGIRLTITPIKPQWNMHFYQFAPEYMRISVEKLSPTCEAIASPALSIVLYGICLFTKFHCAYYTEPQRLTWSQHMHQSVPSYHSSERELCIASLYDGNAAIFRRLRRNAQLSTRYCRNHTSATKKHYLSAMCK